MRKYAAINGNIVSEICILDETTYCDEIVRHEMLIDIEDTLPSPEVGWILDGNCLKPQTPREPSDEQDAKQQTSQRLFGLKLLPTLIDLVGQRNLKLTREGTPINVIALVNNVASIKLLLETGALKTARGICYAIRNSFPEHIDIFNVAISEISNFLSANGFE